jgi:RNA recognition motif-containing protein
MNIYVGNLSQQASDQDLEELFKEFGAVTSVKIIRDMFTGESKGFAFVEMENEAEARQAIALYSGHRIHAQALIVNEARPSETQPSNVPLAARPKFREIKHKRRGGGNIHRFH